MHKIRSFQSLNWQKLTVTDQCVRDLAVTCSVSVAVSTLASGRRSYLQPHVTFFSRVCRPLVNYIENTARIRVM